MKPEGGRLGGEWVFALPGLEHDRINGIRAALRRFGRRRGAVTFLLP